MGVVVARFQLVLFPGFHVVTVCCNAHVAGAAEKHWYAEGKVFSTVLKAAWMKRFILALEFAKPAFTAFVF